MKKRAELKLFAVHEFIDLATAITVRFEPVKDVPGFTHRVRIVYKSQMLVKDWLGDTFKPTNRNAVYYLAKHREKLQEQFPGTDLSHFVSPMWP